MMDRFTGGTEAGRATVIAQEPVGRMGRPDEIAAAVAYLCSDAAAFTIGHALVIDGGQTILTDRPPNQLTQHQHSLRETTMILEDSYTLANGVHIPKLGLGTWFIDNDGTAEAIRQATTIGYRHVDTAQAYGNEEGVGDGIRTCGVPRDEMFVRASSPPRSSPTRRRTPRSTSPSPGPGSSTST